MGFPKIRMSSGVRNYQLQYRLMQTSMQLATFSPPDLLQIHKTDGNQPQMNADKTRI
jgi:hypothetical protein